MIEVILIDADDTLFDYQKAETHALFSSFEYFNIEGDFLDIQKKYNVINKKLWLDLENGKIEKEVLKYKRFEYLSIEYNFDYNPVEFSRYYLSKLGEGTFLFDGSEEICEYLNHNYKLVIVTNGIKEVQLSRINNSTISNFISEIVISDEIGISKPDYKIFEYALNKINYTGSKDRVIMVGDSLTADIQGGINYGIKTCWVNLFGKENNLNINPTYEINDLYNLKNIL